MEEFTFNASAIGAGGIIQRGDVRYVIPSLASLALAPTGGEGRSITTNYYSEELSFSHAETRVYGHEHPGGGVFTSFTYVFMKDVRVFDRLYINEMRGTIQSTRKFKDPEDHDFKVEFWYEGVRVRGRGADKPQPVDPKADRTIESVRRYEQLEQLLTGGRIPQDVVAPSDRKGLAQRFSVKAPDSVAQRFKDKRAVRGSIVQTIEGGVEGCRHNKIFIPGLGTVIFGELMAKPGRRRLTLLRIALGDVPQMDFGDEGPEADAGGGGGAAMDFQEAPTGPGLGGSMTVASVEGNGTIVGP
jgi:hypothetical protein